MVNRVTAEQKKVVVELDYVEFVNGNMTGPWKCKKCHLESKGRPNRIISHLLCMEDKGVKICTYMKENPDEKEELARKLGRDPHPEQIGMPMDETFSTNGVGSEMLNGIHQGQSSQPNSTQPSFPQANPDQREELARRLVETNAVCSRMINTIHQGQSSQSDSTQPFFPRANPDEMEELARELSRNPQPVSMDEMFRTGASLEDNNDGAEKTNAVGAEIINTTHQGQPSQPDSARPSFPQGGMDLCMDDPMPTPSHVNFDRMHDQYIHPSQDGATVDPSMAVSSMGIETQQQLQPGVEDDSLNSLGDTENTPPRAVISNVCANREHHPDVPDLGSAGREMQNAVSQEKGSKRRKCAQGSGTSAAALQLDNSEQSSSFSVSNLIISPPETWDASMPVPRETGTPPSHGQERARIPNTNNDGVQQTNAVASGLSNTIHQGQSSQPDSTQVFSSQGGMDMGLCDQIPPPPQVNNSDHVNDQHMHPLQDGVGTDASIPRNAFGVGVAGEPDSANPPPCPLNFPPDLWDFYLQIDKSGFCLGMLDDFSLYRDCLLFADEKERKNWLDCLASACIKVRNYSTNAPGDSREDLWLRLYKSFWEEGRSLLGGWLDTVDGMEPKIREAAGKEVGVLGTERKVEMEYWLGYVGRIKSDVSILDLEAKNAKSPSEILPLLKRMDGLINGARKLIEMGTSLLNPVPKDLLSWNPSFMCCGSQLQNQMASGQFPQQV